MSSLLISPFFVIVATGMSSAASFQCLIFAAELIKQLGTRDLSPNKTYRLTVQYAVLFWVNGFSANNIVGFAGGNARQFKSLVGPLDGSHYKVYKDDYYFYIKTDVNTGLTLCPFGYFGDLEIEETDVDVSGLVLLQ